MSSSDRAEDSDAGRGVSVGRGRKFREPEFEPWDREGWSWSKRERVSNCLFRQKHRRKKEPRAEISKTKRDQEVKKWIRMRGG